MIQNFFINKNDNMQSFGNTPSSFSQRLPFCIYGCGHFYATKPYFTEREGAENRYMLIYTRSGLGYLKYKENEYQLVPNSVVVFNARNYHYYSTTSEDPWEFKWLYFYGSAINEYDEMINIEKLNMINLNETQYIEHLLDQIFLCIKNRELLLDVKICSYIMNLLTELIFRKFDNVNSKKSLKHKSDIDIAISFIQKNFDKKIMADDIINQLHISKFHFLRLFKSYTGFNLHEYLCNYRINKAKELLRTTNDSVEEVAFLVGFNSSNNFIRYFKKATDMTPETYRKFSLY